MPQSARQQPDYLTTREVADLLRVKERKVYDLAATNEIPHRRITGKLLFPASEIRAWIEGSGSLVSEDRPAVITGSHDPLLDWAIRDSACGLATLFNGSREGLDCFARHRAALSGLHIPEQTGWNVASVSELGVTDAVLIGWASRKRGLLVSSDAANDIHSVTGLKGKRVVRRQPGAGAAALFSRLLGEAGLNEEDLQSSSGFAHTESEAAGAVASGEADAALGVQAMAKQYKLGFVPLTDEHFDLLIDRKAYFTDPVQLLLNFTRTQQFQDKAASMGGYDLTPLGRVRWLSP
ncbi:helix-turn-helix transcriptional regulator [Roseibium alexandrii]|uniref:helix-turn-helix transcriptional regulator n=1 Tax=Roseibium alexandrii TaxID=388408 RepID=UPI001D19282C|nr:helix-turn-helix transcriptional regulator [Roseibium alexandrii]